MLKNFPRKAFNKESVKMFSKIQLLNKLCSEVDGHLNIGSFCLENKIKIGGLILENSKILRRERVIKADSKTVSLFFASQSRKCL